MSLEVAIRAAMLAQVPEFLAAIRAELERPRLVPIKAAIVSYRTLLKAEASGELKVYRVGNASLVDEAELYEWIKRTGAKATPKTEEPSDEIGELIELQDGKRKRRAG